MILLWLILDQKKIEKQCREEGTNPAVSMKERLRAYFLVIVVPIVVGLLMR